MGFKLIFAFSVLFQAAIALPDHIYGASVHWRPNGNQSIVLSYRLTWEYGQIACLRAPTSIINCKNFLLSTGKGVKDSGQHFQTFQWICTSGCNATTHVSDLSELFFTDIGEFHGFKYESGIGSIQVTFQSSDDMANIRIGLEKSAGIAEEDFGEGHLNLATRNDTKRANISPVLNIFPVSRIPLGCSTTIKLYPFDGDGDYVKCHWEKFPLPSDPKIHAVLNEDLCEINLKAESPLFQADDKLQLSLYAEDYSWFPVQFSGVSSHISTGPFSRSPLKLLILIGNSTTGCDSAPSFTKRGTLKPYFKKSYMLPFEYNLVKLPFETDIETNEILTTGPRYMAFEERHNVTSIDEGVWKNLTDSTMKGIHQACGQAYTADGNPGESRCAVLMVNEPDECESSPCNRSPGGICDNLFEYYTCSYPGDPTYAHNRWTGPCEPERIVQKGNDNLGVKVGVPVAVSLLLILIIVGVTMYLKRYLTEKMKKSAVEPEGAVQLANKKADTA